MDLNTNRKKRSEQRVLSRRRRLSFWEATLADAEQEFTASQPKKTGLDQDLVRPPTAKPDDVCPVSKSIEEVFKSKSDARQQRAIEQQRTLSYQDETCRPVVCLAFVLPLLLVYEIGSILLGHQALRTGVDQWFHQPLSHLGLGSVVVLPIVTIAIMLLWHHQRDDHWIVRPQILLGMLVEAIGLGLILFWAANAIHQLTDGAQVAAATAAVSKTTWWASIVACVGSGIYEELIFRIGLLTLLTIWAGKFVRSETTATVIGVIAVSLLFASLHYSVFNPAGNPFELSSFVFRTFASIVFCGLFLFRGFGIAVGAHVAYDVLTQV